MISNLHISRFKSIKELSLDCRRINLFIGEPNTGKSNILEALGMFSSLMYSSGNIASGKQFVRFERTSNLFYDESLDQGVEIQCDATTLKMEFRDGLFRGACREGGTLPPIWEFVADHTGFPGFQFRHQVLAPFKFYRFSVKETFGRPETEFLLPPSGENLLSLLMANRGLRGIVNQPFLARGLRLGLRPQEGKIEVIKQWEDVIISYPYSLTSDTLQRLTFYLAAILSNKKSVLAFEEPEAHAFPYYTKHLGEVIALDESQNQYFISTHNPYFLLAVLEKAPKDDVSVHIVYYKDYETKAKMLGEKDIQEMMELDVFFNLDRYLEEG